MSRLVTGSPSATFHGKAISTGGNRFMCARSVSATGPGSGTSRSLPPFGGANTALLRLSLSCWTTWSVSESKSTASTATPRISP